MNTRYKKLLLHLILLFLICVRVPAQSFPTQTTAPLHYYVSQALGDDANSCEFPVPLFSPRLGPCKTIQGALNKIPKRLRHVVTVTVAPGYYEGFVVEGFEVHPSWTRDGTGAGLIIQGTTKLASPTTGTATGTASSPCDGGGFKFFTNQQNVTGWVFDANVHSTLEDSKQAWTAHDPKLRGRKLCLTSGKGSGECLAIEDNDKTTITVAGYWADFHSGWVNLGIQGKTLNAGCAAGDTYVISEPDTHLYRPVPLPQGIGGLANGQASLPDIAAIIVSNVHGGASATAGNGQPADNFQILIKDFDVLKDDCAAKLGNCSGKAVHSVAFVDSSDHIGFKHFTTGINGGPHPGLYSGAGLFVFRNSTAWTVQSSYANGDAPTTSSSPMISCSRPATADAWVGVFGNVVDNMPSYFGDSSTAQTGCASSVIFGGESIRDTGGDAGGTSPAAIQIHSASLVHFVGTKINGSRINPNVPNTRFTADCVLLGDARVTNGGGTVNFEGGDFSNCSGSGIRLAGHWIGTFINNPTTSAAGANGRWAIEAANGARVLGLGCASNDQPFIDDPDRTKWTACARPGPDQLRGHFHPVDLSFDHDQTGFSYDEVMKAPGLTITDPQRGGLFSFGLGEAISATSAAPPNWISFGQGVVYGFTSVSDGTYIAKNYDHVIAMSNDAARTVTIPGKRPAGTHYIIIDTSGSANAGHTITVTSSLGCINAVGCINGAANAVITPGTNKALEVISDGANYWIISLK